MTREEIESLQPGTKLQMAHCTAFGKALPETEWGPVREITRILARRENINHQLFACFYTTFGDNGEMSGSICEGEEHYRIAE